MRRFNTTGPCEPDRHYLVPPLARLPQARTLVEQGDYFVLHAPRQSGKTTTLRALARALTAEGTFAALHFSCETLRAVLRQLRDGFPRRPADFPWVAVLCGLRDVRARGCGAHRRLGRPG